jgi:hypothetical protein
MHKQTIILIVVLALVTGVLIFLAVTNQNILKTNNTGTVPTTASVQKTAKVFFNPASVDLSAATATPTSSVDIFVDSGGEPISGVQAEMQYDPKAITNVKIIPAADLTGFFGAGSTIPFNEVNQTTGRISYAIGISPTENGKTGVGKIGTMTFQKTPGTTLVATGVNFLDKTLVTKLNVNESLLKETTPLTITLSKGTTQTVPLSSPTTFIQVSPTQ